MIQPDSYKKGLWKIALISSIAWGVISKFPMINARKPFFFDDRRPRPRLSREFPFPAHDENAFVSGAIITCFMLSLWLMNMYLYQWVSTFHRSDKTKNFIRYALSFLLAVVAYYLCVALILLVAEGPHFRIFPLIVALTNNTIIIVLMDLIILQRKSAQIAVENSELKMNHAIAQHQHLKHQLQPHFLFNSLNTLKSLIKKQRPEAEEYLVRLSDLLRASITAHQETTIPLKEELKLCVDYLEMQKVRFKDSFRYQIDVPEQVLSQGRLPVFSLQLLVENAMKHNAFTPEEPLAIQITYQEPGSIVVRNNKKAKQTLEPSSGIGLKNLFERYQVISGHGIRLEDTETYFSVELTLL